MKNKKLTIAIVVMLVVVMIVGIAASVAHSSSSATDGQQTADNEENESPKTDADDQKQDSSNANDNTSNSMDDSSWQNDNSVQKEDAESVGEGQNSGGNVDTTENQEEAPTGDNEGSDNSSQSGNDDSSEPSKSDESQPSVTPNPDLPTISIPYDIPDSNITIEQVSSYSGYYIEDVSDKEVSNVAAIVVTNHGGDLDFLGVGISQRDRSLGFSASSIPAGATVIILEQTGAAYYDGGYYSCTATTTESSGFTVDNGTVKVEDNGDDTFTVYNLSNKAVSNLTVFYKSYLPDEDVYVGGVTYSVKLNDLEPNSATEVTAGHYDSEYSKIVNIRKGN